MKVSLAPLGAWILIVGLAVAAPPRLLPAASGSLSGPVADQTARVGPLEMPLAAMPAIQSGAMDLKIAGLELTQGLPQEPLVVGRATAARVQISIPAAAQVGIQVRLEAGGQVYERTTLLTGPVMTITVGLNPPIEVKPVTARVWVTPTGQVTDPNPADNTSTAVYPTVLTTERIVVFFLPVDWTPEDRTRYGLDTMFKRYAQEAGAFLAAAYPLPGDHVALDLTLAPHMLSPFEKTLADSQGRFNMRNALALYGSISYAARRLRPDATMVVGVFPPGWFRKHGQPGTVGLALTDVRGVVTSQWEPDLPPIVAAHEIGHLFGEDEDYDYAVKPARPCTQVLVPGFWVDREQELANRPDQNLCTFMSSASRQSAYWVDRRIYEYLMSKFAMAGGTASAPLILSATLTSKLDSDGEPSGTNANVQRFEPNQSIYCSVAGIALKPGSILEGRLFRGGTLLRTLDRQTTVAGNHWYPFLIAGSRSLREDTYRLEIFLDGQLIKTSPFEVKASE